MKKVRIANGYRLVYMPSHSRSYKKANWAGWVYEHIVKAERCLGRPLRDNEEVHHLDFDRSNNQSSNLLVLEKSQHTKLHNWVSNCASLAKAIEQNRMKTEKAKVIRECEVCSLQLDNTQKRFCSIECNGWSQRRCRRPTKTELAHLIEEMSWVAIGRKYGVSDNAVRKWARKYELLS